MGGDVDDFEFGCGQHHRHFLGAGQVGEQLGVSGVDVPGGVQGFLVQRCGADRLHFAAHREFAGDADVFVRGVPGDRRQLAPGEILREQVEVDDVDPARRGVGVLD